MACQPKLLIFNIGNFKISTKSFIIWMCKKIETLTSFKYTSEYISLHDILVTPSSHAKGYKNNLKQAHRIVTNNVKIPSKFVEDFRNTKFN